MTFDEELKKILKDELIILNKFVELSFRKTNIIMEDNLDKIGEIAKKEEQYVNAMLTLENNRIKHLDSWGVAIDTPISAIIKQLPNESKDLEEIKNEMEDLIERLSNQNDINNKLIQQNIEWIDFNINLMTSAQTPVGYGQGEDGQQGLGDSTMFDRKV